MPYLSKLSFSLSGVSQKDFDLIEIKKFYNSWSWRKVSKAYRAEHPLCAEAMRQKKATGFDHVRHAQVVDHIIPIRFGGSRWDERNFQSLSRRNHQIKTAEERDAPIYQFEKNKHGDLIPLFFNGQPLPA